MPGITLITIGILLIFSSVDSSSVGRVDNARFTSVDQLNIGSIWLFSFSTWSQCVCEVLSSNFSSIAIAINMYRNGSCQLFTTLPSTFTLEVNINSTLILFKSLPVINNLSPCCSNLSWLMNQINTSQQASVNISKPGYVILDNNNYLVAVSYKVSTTQLNRTTLNAILVTAAISSPTSLSYHNGFYYIPSSPTPTAVYVVSTKNFSVIANISLSSSPVIREITFVRNNSLMLIADNGNSRILFYDVQSIKNYTQSTPSSINITNPCGLYAVNDSFVYVTSWYSGLSPTPVSTLTLSNNTWKLSQLTNTTPSSGENSFQSTVDSCGRLWLAVNGYGIRIFDPWGRTLLYQWPVTPYMDGFLLLNNYELFVTNFTGNQILHFNPNIGQCTS